MFKYRDHKHEVITEYAEQWAQIIGRENLICQKETQKKNVAQVKHVKFENDNEGDEVIRAKVFLPRDCLGTVPGENAEEEIHPLYILMQNNKVMRLWKADQILRSVLSEVYIITHIETITSIFSLNSSSLQVRKIPYMFCLDIFIRSVSRMSGHSWGFLEDVEGS